MVTEFWYLRGFGKPWGNLSLTSRVLIIQPKEVKIKQKSLVCSTPSYQIS